MSAKECQELIRGVGTESTLKNAGLLSWPLAFQPRIRAHRLPIDGQSQLWVVFPGIGGPDPSDVQRANLIAPQILPA